MKDGAPTAYREAEAAKVVRARAGAPRRGPRSREGAGATPRRRPRARVRVGERRLPELRTRRPARVGGPGSCATGGAAARIPRTAARNQEDLAMAGRLSATLPLRHRPQERPPDGRPEADGRRVRRAPPEPGHG